MSPEELAYRERLAQHLFDVRWPKEGDICPPVYDATNKSGRLRVVDAALSALKGPRTGEELFAALDAAWQLEGLGARLWEDIPPELKRGYSSVAATFAAPLIPEGWPEGWSIGPGSNMPALDVDRLYRSDVLYRGKTHAVVYGPTYEAVKELARLAAWALASQRPAMSSAPTGPCPDGWAEGWTVASTGAGDYPGLRWRTTPGTTFFLPDTEDGRYASHVLAGWRPSSSPGVSKQVYEDLKRSHEEASTIQRRKVDYLWEQIHDLKRDLLAAKRMAEVDDNVHRRAVAERIGFAVPADPEFVPGWQTLYDAVASAWSSLRCAREEAIPNLAKERDSLRARAESCHDALMAAKRANKLVCAGIEAKVSAARETVISGVLSALHVADPPQSDNLGKAIGQHYEHGRLRGVSGAAAILATHLSSEIVGLFLDTLIDLVKTGTISADDYRTARRSPSALAALLLRVRGPVEVEGGAA